MTQQPSTPPAQGPPAPPSPQPIPENWSIGKTVDGVWVVITIQGVRGTCVHFILPEVAKFLGNNLIGASSSIVIPHGPLFGSNGSGGGS